MILRPMLAARLEDPTALRFPVVLNPKYDGIRCLKVGGTALSRAFKPIRNTAVQEALSQLPDGVDGELIVPGGSYSDVQSVIMSEDGGNCFEYHVFDLASEAPYTERIAEAMKLPDLPWLKVTEPHSAEDLSDFLAYYEACLSAGYEGVIARDPGGCYKAGRSTLKEQLLVKYKPVHDSEALVLGFEEQMENANPVVPNAFGYAKRPGGKAFHIPKGTLGSLLVRDICSGVEFSVGSGLDDALRRRIWSDPASYIGRVIRYKHQPCGAKDRPRFPRFDGFRED